MLEIDPFFLNLLFLSRYFNVCFTQNRTVVFISIVVYRNRQVNLSKANLVLCWVSCHHLLFSVIKGTSVEAVWWAVIVNAKILKRVAYFQTFVEVMKGCFPLAYGLGWQRWRWCQSKGGWTVWLPQVNNSSQIQPRASLLSARQETHLWWLSVE